MSQQYTSIEFNGTVLPNNLPEGTSVEQTREALARFYPEVANASHTIEDGVLKFTVQANEKG